ncbi:MAG: hypothetical protein R3Y57_07565, partial [Erysipelotrichaceae bacterium]
MNVNHDDYYQNSICDTKYSWRAVYNDNISFVTKSYPDGRLKCRIDEKNHHLLDGLSYNQTSSVNSLKSLFEIREKDIPCLIFIPLDNHIIYNESQHEIYKIKLSENSDFYLYFKELAEEIEDIASEISRIEKSLGEINCDYDDLSKELKVRKYIIENYNAFLSLENDLLTLIGIGVDIYTKDFLKIYMGTLHFSSFNSNIRIDIQNKIRTLVSMYKYIDVYPYTIMVLEDEIKYTQQVQNIKKQIHELCNQKNIYQQDLSNSYHRQRNVIREVKMRSRKKDISNTNTITIGNDNTNISISLGENIENNQVYIFDYSLAKESLDKIANEIEKLQLNNNYEIKEKIDFAMELLNNNCNPRKIKPLIMDVKNLL